MTSFAAGSVPVSGMTWAVPHVCVALCARAVLAYNIMAATDSTGATFSAACFSVIMFLAPLIRVAFDMSDHTGKRHTKSIGRWCWDRAGTDQHHRPMDSMPAACSNRGGNRVRSGKRQDTC